MKRLRGLAAWLFALAYLCLIWWLSSHATDFRVLDKVPLRDKGVHFLEYGALSVMFTDALLHASLLPAWRIALLAPWLTLCAGLLDELHQVLVFGRSGDVFDLIADAVGALCAMLGYFALRAVLQRVARTKLSPP